ncbi:MAG: TIGR04083 family peptide-modifying radical SAM enzyme [Methanoregula sp.]|jgi:uncharacterized protein
MKNPFHVMIIPTLGCPSKCKYCWSSEVGSPVMTTQTVRDIVEWLKDLDRDRVTFTFHGGEPLLAGAGFYREALPLLADGLPRMHPDFAMQTNLWLMTPEIADTLAEYRVPIGSSIDGPEVITDSQRGDGYFRKTMNGYRVAKEHGLDVRFICTFTNKSVKQRDEIFNFFLQQGFTLKLHPALPSLKSENPKEWALEPAEYGNLLVYLLDQSLEHINDIEVMNISDLCRCIFTRHGSVCTYVDCMGSTFAIGPDGNIYPCYRFIGMPEFVMGNVADHPSLETLMASPAGTMMLGFKDYVDTACKDCRHIRYCRGGCPYNAMAPTPGRIEGVDPHCTAYKRIFEEIGSRLDKEMFDTPMMEMDAFGVPGATARKPQKSGVMALMRKMAMR